MSKKISIIASLLLAVALIAGACSANTPSANQNSSNQINTSQNSNGNNGKSGKITVTVMTWESNDTNAAIDEALNTFMAANPDITVQRIPSPNSGYGDKLNAMVQANQMPDIFWAGNDTAFLYGDQGLLYDWSSYAKKASGDFSLSQFAPGAIENWTSPSGKLYGLPTLMNTYGLWYNEDLFKAANLPLPKPGWTYDEMFKDAQALTIKNGKKITRYGLYNQNGDAIFGPFAVSDCSVSAGGQPFMDRIISPNKVQADAQFIACTQKWADAIQNGYVTPPDYPTDGMTEQFLAGQIPMVYFGQWAAPILIQAAPSFKFGFAPLPINKDVVEPYDAVGISSPAILKNPDAVWKVMEFLASGAWKTVLTKSPVAPAANVPSSQPYFDTLKSDGLQSVADGVNYELTAPVKQGIRFTAPWSAKANDILGAYWNDILTGKKPVESGVNDMVKELNNVISSNSSGN